MRFFAVFRKQVNRVLGKISLIWTSVVKNNWSWLIVRNDYNADTHLKIHFFAALLAICLI